MLSLLLHLCSTGFTTIVQEHLESVLNPTAAKASLIGRFSGFVACSIWLRQFKGKRCASYERPTATWDKCVTLDLAEETFINPSVTFSLSQGNFVNSKLSLKFSK
jgi:hypothetical protein